MGTSRIASSASGGSGGRRVTGKMIAETQRYDDRLGALAQLGERRLSQLFCATISDTSTDEWHNATDKADNRPGGRRSVFRSSPLPEEDRRNHEAVASSAPRLREMGGQTV